MKNIFKLVPAFLVNDLSGAKKLFVENKKYLNVCYDFNFLINNTHLYLLFKNEKLTGGIYYFNDDALENFLRNYFNLGKGGGGRLLFMNGFSVRKMLAGNLFAIKETAKYYSSDIFSVTDKRPASLCLAFAGFKKVPENNVLETEQKIQLFRLKNR